MCKYSLTALPKNVNVLTVVVIYFCCCNIEICFKIGKLHTILENNICLRVMFSKLECFDYCEIFLLL